MAPSPIDGDHVLLCAGCWVLTAEVGGPGAGKSEGGEVCSKPGAVFRTEVGACGCVWGRLGGWEEPEGAC